MWACSRPEPVVAKMRRIFDDDEDRNALCVPPEQALASAPKLKRLWKARNSLSAKLSERRARLKREGIIAHEYATDEDSSTGAEDDGDRERSLGAHAVSLE
jgi:hypothetical protein